MSQATATLGLGRRSGVWAIVLAFFLPIVGFAYVRRIGFGLLFPVVPLLLMWAGGRTGLVQSVWGFYSLLAALMLVQVAVLVLAYRLAKGMPVGTARRWYNRWFHYAWLTVASVLLVNVLLGEWVVANRGPAFGYETFRIPSTSMQPSLQAGDFVVVDTRPAAVSMPRRGDVVTYVPHSDPDQTWVARVIGLPGEEVDARGGVVRVDGQPVVESYLQAAGNAAAVAGPFLSMRLGGDEFFLLGDNRPRSDDSRYQGAYPQSAFRGRVRAVWFSYLPNRGIAFSRIGAIAQTAPERNN